MTVTRIERVTSSDWKKVDSVATINPTKNGLLLIDTYSCEFICKNEFGGFAVGRQVEIFRQTVWNTANGDESESLYHIIIAFTQREGKWVRECIRDEKVAIADEDLYANFIRVPEGYRAKYT